MSVASHNDVKLQLQHRAVVACQDAKIRQIEIVHGVEHRTAIDVCKVATDCAIAVVERIVLRKVTLLYKWHRVM
jgi:hypothetical protein